METARLSKILYTFSAAIGKLQMLPLILENSLKWHIERFHRCIYHLKTLFGDVTTALHPPKAWERFVDDVY